MNSVADRLKTNPQASKKPTLYTSLTVRKNSIAKAHAIADLSSKFHRVKVFLVAAGLPRDPEDQDFMKYFRDENTERSTAEFIHKRDEFLRKKLPTLYARGLIPEYRTKCIQALVLFFREDKETQNFWDDFCGLKS